MGLRTYLPTLRIVVRAVCQYIGDHEEKIKEFIGDENAHIVDNANLACASLVAVLDLVIPVAT